MSEWAPAHPEGLVSGEGRRRSNARVAHLSLTDTLCDGDSSRHDESRKGSDVRDQVDMYRMGKTQELKRNYRPLSVLSFAIVLTAIWEYLLVASTQGLINGGSAGLFWSYIWTIVGFTFVELSLAEMASMAPTSGGQYHWVSEFAPPEWQRPLSYLVGWMSTLSWQAGNAADCFLTGTMAQALIVFNKPNYEPQKWQGMLIVFAMIFLILIFNIWGHNFWPRVQNALMVLHVLSFCAIIVILWCLAPHRSPKAVFTEFSNFGGWSSVGLSMMVGQITSIYSILGSDATAHMAEEVRDAARNVPMSLFWSYFGNSIMGVILLATFLFALDDIPAALASKTGFPFMYVFSQTLTPSGVNALTIIIMLLISAANINFGASTARQTFAFARDRGLPFSSWIAAVDSGKEIPINAILLTSGVAVVLVLVNMGSLTAFHAIVSLQVSSLMFTYMCSLTCILYRRIQHPESLPVVSWSMGRWGLPVNVLGLMYSLFSFFWSFWPSFTPIMLDDFNWSSVLFVAVFIACLIMYWFQGRYVYKGPVTHVRTRIGAM